jgi:hypothetical protein
MAEDCVDNFIINIAPFSQVRSANKRMLLLGRVQLVIEVVQQPAHNPPVDLAWLDALGIPSHAGCNTFHMLAKSRALHPLLHYIARCLNGHAHEDDSLLRLIKFARAQYVGIH